MLKRILFGLLAIIPSYFVGFAAGMLIITEFSSNMHDRSVEAAMTSAFVFGPMAAVAGFILTLILTKPARPS